MITFLPGSSRPHVPDTIERDSRTYVWREVAAMNVRDGDLIAFYDLTGPPGTIGEYSIGEVWHVDKFSARECPAPWNRVQINVRNYRGNLRSYMVPSPGHNYAPRDRVEVWRSVA